MKENKKNNDAQPHVIFFGQNGFPSGYAEIQKLKLLAKSLIHSSCDVTIINRLWMLGHCPEDFEPKVNGVYDRINYFFACGTPKRPSSFLVRNLKRFIAPFKEIYIAWRISKTSNVIGGIIGVNLFWDVIRYRIISKLLSFPIVINIMEQRSEIVYGKNPLRHLDAWLFDHFIYYFVDGVFTISDHLTSNVKRYAPNKPHMKIPVLVDLSRYEKVSTNRGEDYILFCGALVYVKVLNFILNSFQYCQSENVFLYLVVNGPKVLHDDLISRIMNHPKKNYIRVFSKLSDDELSNLYVNALALLIPLQPTIQDKARFPHKIGEYCASGRPIITTNYGEVAKYFEHRKTAFITDEFNEEKYAKMIDEAISDPVIADEVGKNGLELCRREFDYLLYGEKIKNFIQSLNEKR